MSQWSHKQRFCDEFSDDSEKLAQEKPVCQC